MSLREPDGQNVGRRQSVWTGTRQSDPRRGHYSAVSGISQEDVLNSSRKGEARKRDTGLGTPRLRKQNVGRNKKEIMMGGSAQ